MTVRRFWIPAVFLVLLTIVFWLREERTPEMPVRQRPVVSVAPAEPDQSPFPESSPTRVPVEKAGPAVAGPGPAPVPPPLALPWRPGYMGINGQDNVGGGMLVQQVYTNTAAWQTGIQVGDVILEFNGRSVSNMETLFQWARSAGEGGPVSLHIRRGGSEFYLGLQLGRHPLYN